MPRGGHREGAGRPPIPIAHADVEKLAGIGCTNDEIAYVLDLHPDTFEKRVKVEPELFEALSKGRAIGKSTLRRYQWEEAKKGNPTMLIWLGKQMLGQRDQFRTEVTGVDGGAIKHEHAHTYTDDERLAAIQSICDSIRDRVGESNPDSAQDVATSAGTATDRVLN